MPRLGEILVKLGACSEHNLGAALDQQSVFGGRLGTNLLRLRALEESQLATALRLRHGVTTLWGEITPDPQARALVTKELVDRYEVVPYLVTRRAVTLLVRDPADCRVLDEMAFVLGRTVRPLVVPEARLWKLMSGWYGVERNLRGAMVGPAAVGSRGDLEDPDPRQLVPDSRDAAPPDLMSEEDFDRIYYGFITR